MPLNTPIGVDHALNERMYKPGLNLEAELSRPLNAFRGSESEEGSAAFIVNERPGLGRGSTIESRFSRIDRDELPKPEGATIIGAESQARTYTSEITCRYYSFDGHVENYVSEQGRVSYDQQGLEVSSIALKWAYLNEKATMNQLVGNTVANTADPTLALSYGNAVVVQDAAHTYYCEDTGGANVSDAEVAAAPTAILHTGVIEDLVMRCRSFAYVLWPCAPCRTPFGDLYVFMVHGVGFKQIRENSTGSDMYDLSKAEIQGGGDYNANPLITGEGFIYGKTLVLSTDFAPRGMTGGAAQANTFCGAFFGAGAGDFLFGEGFAEGDHLGYSEHMIHRRLSILTDTVHGFKRRVVDGESWGAFRVVHYSPV